MHLLEAPALLELVHAARWLRPLRVRISVVADPHLVVYEVPGTEEFDAVAMSVADALERMRATRYEQ